MDNQLLVHVNGQDGPGITATIMNYLDKSEMQLLDIEQAIVHQHLSLQLLVQTSISPQQMKQDLAQYLKKFSLHIKTEEVSGRRSVADPANRFVTTMIADEVNPRCIAEITAAIAEFDANIETIRKLNNGGLETIELISSHKGVLDLPTITEKLLEVAGTFPDLDLAVQRENLYRRSKRLILFDMDSTLIKGEVIDMLAQQVGKEKEIKALTERAMAGEMDFKTSLLERVKALKGLTMEQVNEVVENLELTLGASTLIKVLKKLGFKVAIISGGFTHFANRLKEKLGAHYVYANQLEFESGVLTGNLEGPIIDKARKADLLELIAQQEGIPLEQVIAVGDGANDVEMLKRAGLGIAFNAKPITKQNVKTAITQKSMTSILYLLGITDNEIQSMGYTIPKLKD